MIPPRIIQRHRGPAGHGVAADGQHGQLLVKDGVEPFKTKWIDPPFQADSVGGPASSEDTEIPVFSGTTGRVITGSGVLLADLVTASLLAGKVDKVAGKALSTNDFTNTYKALLDNLPTARFRGVFVNLATLIATYPTGVVGDYAYILKAGDPPLIAVWDSVATAWDTVGSDTIVTGADIFSDLDTYTQEDCRIFTSNEKSILANHEALISQYINGVGATITSYREVSGSYSATNNDRTINVVTDDSVTITLPTALNNSGRIFVIKNSGSGTVTIDPDSNQTIDGNATHQLTVQWTSLTIQCTGVNWIII